MSPEARISLKDLLYHIEYAYDHNMNYIGDYDEDGKMTEVDVKWLLNGAVKDMMGWYCLDCRVSCFDNDEYYMVHDSVWLQAHPDNDGMLCISCLEDRLERELDKTDFTDCPLNEMNQTQGSELLKSRLTQTKEVKWQ